MSTQEFFDAGFERARAGERPTMTAPFRPMDADAFAAGYAAGVIAGPGPETCAGCHGELMPADDEFCGECRNPRA